MEKMTLTVTEVAEVLGLSRGLTYELIRDGRLPAIRLGSKRLVIPKIALERFLQAAATPAAGE